MEFKLIDGGIFVTIQCDNGDYFNIPKDSLHIIASAVDWAISAAKPFYNTLMNSDFHLEVISIKKDIIMSDGNLITIMLDGNAQTIEINPITSIQLTIAHQNNVSISIKGFAAITKLMFDFGAFAFDIRGRN